MSIALVENQFPKRRGFLNEEEAFTVSAICNRLSRMLGLTDREGLQEDIAIVQSECPINLEALLLSRDEVFVEELLTIVDATDRSTGSLMEGYRSRFAVDGQHTLVA